MSDDHLSVRTTGRTGRRQIVLLILLGLLCLFGLTGCVQGDCDVTVNWDGSAVLNYELNLDFPLPDSFPQDTLDEFAAQNGYEANVRSDSSTSQIVLNKKLENFQDLPAALQETVDISEQLIDGSLTDDGLDKSNNNNSSNNNKSNQQPDGIPELKLPEGLPQPPVSTNDIPKNLNLAGNSQIKNAITVEEGIFINTYHVNANVDLSNLQPYNPDEDIISFGLSMLFEAVTNDADLKFRIHLPLAPESSNATTVSNGGKTLEWQILMGQNNNVQFDLNAPNLLNIALTIGLLALLLVIAFCIYWLLIRPA